MKREIKFRAINELADGIEIVTQENSGLNNYQILERFSIVEQYTGIKDANGVEIYEGDIIQDEIEYITDVVFWDNKDACFNTKPNYIDWETMPDPNIKVIGNIHENPDLLNPE